MPLNRMTDYFFRQRHRSERQRKLSLVNFLRKFLYCIAFYNIMVIVFVVFTNDVRYLLCKKLLKCASAFTEF